MRNVFAYSIGSYFLVLLVEYYISSISFTALQAL